MISLSQIESDLVLALKARKAITVDTLRALKTRIQNEQIAKMKDLEESDIFSIAQSEIKRRKEAAESFKKGGREDLAEKELLESEVLVAYLPPQVGESEIGIFIDQHILTHGFTSQDFGKGMGMLKQHFGSSADGALLSKVLKEKLK